MTHTVATRDDRDTTDDRPARGARDVERKIPTRRISFEESLAELPKHFAGEGDLIMSHVVATMSALFPDGEDFFVRSVRAFRDQVTDPELKRDVAGFIGQEAIHGREHRALNDRFAALGYPSKRVERFTRWGLETRERIMPPITNLAATAALEHYTATLAEVLLRDPEARAAIGDPRVLDILLWHALEESEHKAVAFDVFKVAGGEERTRVFTMNAVTFGFIASTTVQVILSMLTDRDTYRGGNLRRSVAQLRRSPFLKRDVWHRLRDYNRPDFHPDDHDTTELVESWRARLFGTEGSLNDKLATSSGAAA